MITLRHPNPAIIDRLVDAWRHIPLSYGPALSLATPPGAGFVLDFNAARLGQGPEAYRAACAALDRWVMFPQWAEVLPTATAQVPGHVVCMTMRTCGVWWINPARILRRYDSPTTHGFAYGTLPEHAECGEEQFMVEQREDGSVWYVLRAFSRPRHPLAWLGFPLARWWQCRFVRDSQRRMREAVAGIE